MKIKSKLQFLPILFLIALAAVTQTPDTGTAESSLAAGTGFTIRNDGLIVDSKQGLMWAPKDNGEDINWFAAQEYCRAYSAGGYSDWRLPTVKELQSLVKPDEKNASGLYVQPFFTLTDFFLWSNEEHTCKATCVNYLTKGMNRFSKARVGVARVLPVRDMLEQVK